MTLADIHNANTRVTRSRARAGDTPDKAAGAATPAKTPLARASPAPTPGTPANTPFALNAPPPTPVSPMTATGGAAGLRVPVSLSDALVSALGVPASSPAVAQKIAPLMETVGEDMVAAMEDLAVDSAAEAKSRRAAEDAPDATMHAEVADVELQTAAGAHVLDGPADMHSEHDDMSDADEAVEEHESEEEVSVRMKMIGLLPPGSIYADVSDGPHHVFFTEGAEGPHVMGAVHADYARVHGLLPSGSIGASHDDAAYTSTRASSHIRFADDSDAQCEEDDADL